MNNVVQMSDYVDKWKVVFSSEDEITTLKIYRHVDTGEIDIIQMNNNDGKCVMTNLDETCARILCDVLNSR